MAGIRLEFAQFGDFDSFDIIRSTSSMASIADADLPNPVVTGLKTMYFFDDTAKSNTTYYYKIRVWRGLESITSSEIIINTNTYQATIFADNPIAYYPLNEKLGTSAVDIMSSPANGEVYNCVMGSDAIAPLLDTSFYFNGVDSYINLGAPDKFLVTGSISMECWIKGGSGNSFSIGFNSGLRMQIGSPLVMIFAGAAKLSTDITTDVEHHIVFTCSTTSLKIYIDGQLATQLASGGGWTGITSNIDSVIGYAGPGKGEYFKGYLSNIALYNHELSAARVLDHFNAGYAA
ncbi:LamG domain-containing protein [Acinetobacter sp. ANC 5383]